LENVWLGAQLVENCTTALARLAGLVAEGQFRTPIDAALPWVEVDEAAGRLARQKVDSKIILEVT
jgi:NADPH:quinone reductase-like Zn-dependent oxidoreductase